MDRTKEPVIQIGILAFLADGKIRDNQEIKAAVARNTNFTEADKARAPNRPNEPKWHQLVNNALSPSRSSSLYEKGFVESCGDELHRITPAGLTQVQQSQMWSKLLNDSFRDFGVGET